MASATDKHGERWLHVVAFDIPTPPAYGGVIDIYYSVKALEQLGIRVHLHTFNYGRGDVNALKNLASKVTVYPRRKERKKLLSATPFIVLTRAHPVLLKNLLKEEYPILFHGLHTTAFLGHPKLTGRKKIVRTHNVEHDYYRGLAYSESSLWTKLYFYLEAWKLKRWEKTLLNADLLAAISEKDTAHFRSLHPNVISVAAFHPNDGVRVPKQTGDYILYHGNLSVVENHVAAMWLVEQVAPHLDVTLMIAGKEPRQELVDAVEKAGGAELFSDLTVDELHQLVQGAQVNVLPTFQATGLKLKLLEALHSGRWCLVNPPMVQGTGLEELCVVAGNASEMVQAIKELWGKAVPADEVAKRMNLLESRFGGKQGAQLLVDAIFS